MEGVVAVEGMSGFTADGFLPGENAAGMFPADAELWENVYRELVEFCRAEGLRHERFEARLAYWRRIRYGHPAPSAHIVPSPDQAETIAE
jgi:hypothetical protein